MLRAYELMIIIDSEAASVAVEDVVAWVDGLIAEEDGEVKSVDNWGRRKFAYKINHKTEGTYVVWEIVTRNAGLPVMQRRLRLADEIVRHKLFRLPEAEAARRGLLVEAKPTSVG